MNIERVYVNTYRYDYILLRICIASIRYWYPDIPIFLIKDYASGKFDTSDIEKKWKLQILVTEIKCFGWGFGKLEPLFLKEDHQFLVLDSDTVMTGYILDSVKDVEADFTVDEELQEISEVKRLYYDTTQVQQIFAGFIYPGYTFNSGQWFGSSNKISKQDIAELVEWKSMPTLKYPQYFMPGDQGIFNLVLHFKERESLVKVHRTEMMIWPNDHAADIVDIESIKSKKNPLNRIIHWAGLKKDKLSEYQRYDILEFYFNYFKKDLGLFQKITTNIFAEWLGIERKVKYRLNRIMPSKQQS